MSLKVYKNGTAYKIDTNLHKPVVFLNGTKYKLDKAFTFINGVKHILWGETGVQIDYISSTGVLGGGKVFAIGENWLDCSYNKTIYRINISNLSNPTLVQNVAWGNIENFNGYQTSAGNMIFSTSDLSSNTTTSNKLQVNPANGTITINRTDVNMGYFLAQTNSNFVTFTNRIKSFATSHSTVSITYGNNFYWNSVLTYSTGRVPANVQDTSGTLKLLNSNALQVGQDSVVFNLTGSYDTGAGLYLGTPNSITRITTSKTGTLLYDGNIVQEYADKSAISLLDPSSFSALYTYQAESGTSLRFIGRIDNYYYVLSVPSTQNSLTGVKLILLDKDDLSVIFSKDLPSDPFNENNSTVAFWFNCTTTPQVSQSGYLGVGTYNSSTLGLRVVRFSAIF